MSVSQPMSLGYASLAYAQTLSSWGEVLVLPHSGGQVLMRPIPGTAEQDAMGCYPAFSCPNWDGIRQDLDWLRDRGAVSLTLVTDIFNGFDPTRHCASFELARSFKKHFVFDLQLSPEKSISAHRRRYARRASRGVQIDYHHKLLSHLDEWCGLYEQLCARHGLQGPLQFSREIFASLFELNVLTLQRASYEGKVLGAQLLLESADVLYVHLAAFTDAGYQSGISHALDIDLLTQKRSRARWVDWGGGRNSDDPLVDGLARYKHGLSTSTRQSWLLGAKLRPDRYAALAAMTGNIGSPYFPEYRSGEFTAGGLRASL